MKFCPEAKDSDKGHSPGGPLQIFEPRNQGLENLQRPRTSRYRPATHRLAPQRLSA